MFRIVRFGSSMTRPPWTAICCLLDLLGVSGRFCTLGIITALTMDPAGSEVQKGSIVAALSHIPRRMLRRWFYVI